MQITPYKALKATLKCKFCSVILNASYAVRLDASYAVWS